MNEDFTPPSECDTSEQKQMFTIDNDNKAEWAIRKVQEIRAERDRLINVCRSQIEEYEAKEERYAKQAENEEGYFIALLHQYFETVPHKETKTQAKYVLPSGSLIRRSKPMQYDRADTLTDELEAKGLESFIKTKKEPDWANIKEHIQIISDVVNVITDDGEVVPLEGVTTTPGASIFEVKI